MVVNFPPGTLGIDEVKGKYGWDKDELHDIKDGAHGVGAKGEGWTGVTPDGIVGVNEGGEWSPVDHWENLL